MRALLVLPLLWLTCFALERPGVEFKVFQFPANRIPTVDGKADDWSMVPESYIVGSNQLKDTVNNLPSPPDAKDLDVRVKVGWVKGMNRLYFLYEASDNYWDFSRPDLHNDIFEIVVDGDLSGGPLIKQMHPFKGMSVEEAHYRFHGVHAQNYHIFTPALNKDWTMVWGCQPWIKELPYANAAYHYNFKPGQSGKLTLEFWITPFDYAPYEGPAGAIESKLAENKLIGLAWSILDYDDVNAKTYRGFWNLSHKTTMYGNASDLVAFRLMPVEPSLRPALEANWTFRVVDLNRRLVAFHDQTVGDVTSWKWDFGDGETSTEQNPVHTFKKSGEFIVILDVKGPKGESRRTKVWDVVMP
ncbi:MAG: PKD domain-containing protein [Bryobacterales bacterium]|nr:PKD domain-containing protein [Bryobacterales bacterium]